MNNATTGANDDDGIMALLKPTTSNVSRKKSRKKVTFSNNLPQNDDDVARKKQASTIESTESGITKTPEDPKSFSRSSTLKPAYELSSINDILIGESVVSEEKYKSQKLQLSDSDNTKRRIQNDLSKTLEEAEGGVRSEEIGSILSGGQPLTKSRTEQYRNAPLHSNSNKSIAMKDNSFPTTERLRHTNAKKSDSFLMLEKERDDLKMALQENQSMVEREIRLKMQAENAMMKQKDSFNEERLKLIESHEKHLKEVNAKHHKELADAIRNALENERINFIHGQVQFSASTLKTLDERLQMRDKIVDDELKQRYEALAEIEQNTVNIQKLNQQDTVKLEGAVHEMGGMMANIKDQHEQEILTIRSQEKKLADLELRLSKEKHDLELFRESEKNKLNQERESFLREQERFQESLEQKTDDLERRTIVLRDKEQLYQENKDNFDEASKSEKERFQMEQDTLLREQDEIRHRKERSERQFQESELQRQEVATSVNQIHQDRERVQRMAQQLSIQANEVGEQSRIANERLEEAKKLESIVVKKGQDLEKEQDRLIHVEQCLQKEKTELEEMKMDVVRHRVNILKEKYRTNA